MTCYLVHSPEYDFYACIYDSISPRWTNWQDTLDEALAISYSSTIRFESKLAAFINDPHTKRIIIDTFTTNSHPELLI